MLAQYGFAQGYPLFREELARFLASHTGVGTSWSVSIQIYIYIYRYMRYIRGSEVGESVRKQTSPQFEPHACCVTCDCPPRSDTALVFAVQMLIQAVYLLLMVPVGAYSYLRPYLRSQATVVSAYTQCHVCCIHCIRAMQSCLCACHSCC